MYDNNKYRMVDLSGTHCILFDKSILGAYFLDIVVAATT